jgi:hypothetical protein
LIRKFSPHLEMLPPPQMDVWPNLRPTAKLGFVLYGGTAIALQLGHRTSLDFDFFSDRPLNRQQLLSVFPFLRHSTLLQDQPQTLSFLVSAVSARQNQVKVSFFGMIDHGRVGDPRWTDDEVLQVASLDDLMATKLKTILQRIEAKDYRDVAAMVKARVSVAKGLAGASRMYGSANFQPSESLKALAYFEGGDLDQLTADDRRVLAGAAREVRDLPPVEVVAKTLGVL